jgi:hypothetical protein
MTSFHILQILNANIKKISQINYGDFFYKTEDRSRKAEVGKQKTENRMQNAKSLHKSSDFCFPFSSKSGVSLLFSVF